jgi:Holliday junction DNA helicase RuvA
MIAWLSGRVARAGSGQVVIDVNGVGYRLLVTPSTLADLLGRPAPVEVSVHTLVREDAITLFGFADESEREVFEVLLGTHGVGPSLSLAILGTLGAGGVVAAVRDGDVAAFETVTGVGKKTAARLALELQGSDLGGIAATAPATLTTSPARTEVVDALTALGYSTEEVKAALSTIEEAGSVEELLRLALRELGRS